jgi:hypothetical protein
MPLRGMARRLLSAFSYSNFNYSQYFSYSQSATHKAGIQAARHGSVVGAFDNGPAIGKEGHLIGIAPELEYKGVMFHRAVRAQLSGHLGKIHWAVALMNLNRVSAAQSNLRPMLTCQVDEFMFLASLAARAWLGGGYLGLFVTPHVKGKQGPSQLVFCAYQELNGFGRLD